jgi:hypothetical protein
MGLGLRPIVQTQHGLDDTVELSREMDGARTTAIGTVGMCHRIQLDSKRARELRNRP